MVSTKGFRNTSPKLAILLKASDIVGRIFLVVSILVLSLTHTLSVFILKPWRGLGHFVDFSVVLLLASLPFLLFGVLSYILILGCKLRNTTLLAFWLTIEKILTTLASLQAIGCLIICVQEGSVVASIVILIVPVSQIVALVVVLLLHLELRKTQFDKHMRPNIDVTTANHTFASSTPNIALH